MESLEHLLVGAAATGAGLALFGGGYALPALLALGAYGVALSVFVDLDHFLLARYYAGDWRHLRAVLADPRNAARGQEWIFADLPIYGERLASHAAIGAALIAGWYAVAPPVAGLTALVLGAHVACDLLRDAGLA